MPTQIYLRPIRETDSDDIAAWFQDAETRQRMAGMLPLDRWLAFVKDSPTQEVWLAVDRQQRAVALIQVEWEIPERAWLSLIVHPAWRQRGYGQALLRLTIAALCKRGVREICCEVAADNAASLHGAQSQGFTGDTQALPTPGYLALIYRCAGAF